MELDSSLEHEDEVEDVQCTRIAFQKFGKLTEMDNTISTGRRWEEMEFDVLVKIFLSFNIIELTSGISRVCSSWRLACCDPILWRTVDFGIMQSNYIKIPAPPYIWVADTSDRLLMKTLKIALSLSRGNVSCIIFHLDLYLRDDHLSYVAERSPHLKRLVLPAWNRITKGGIIAAVRKWAKLESLTMPSIRDPPYILEEIAINCEKFTELKIMGTFDVHFASTIRTFLPRLKVLSLRCSLLHKEALKIILESLECLEVLNISHCLFVEKRPPPAPKKLLREIDESIVLKASRLQNFITCQDELCALCQRMTTDEGYLRWYKFEEELWRKDEAMFWISQTVSLLGLVKNAAAGTEWGDRRTGHVIKIDRHNPYTYNEEDTGLVVKELNSSLIKFKHLSYLRLSWKSFSGSRILKFLGSFCYLSILITLIMHIQWKNPS